MTFPQKKPKREEVKATPRHHISKKLRAEVFLASAGRCEVCSLKIMGTFDVDHRLALHHGGLDEVGNMRALHPECHRQKTKGDRTISAKINRINKTEAGERKAKRAIPNRGFETTLTKGFDGKVRPRQSRPFTPGRDTGAQS